MPFQIDGRGDMNAFVLTSPLAGVMLLTRRQPFYPSAAHDKFFSICTAFGGYTEFGIAPQAALDALDTFGEHWDRKYPKISRSWRDNWANLSTYFKYPQEVRRLIYTTNAIEGFNRQLRKVTKAKSVFPTDDSLLKMLYLAMMDITKKWTGRRQDWSVIHAQMAVYFAERMPE